MSYLNRDGQAGTVAALRASNPVDRRLIGPDGGAVEGMQDQAGAGPGAAIDSAIADHEQRISALELGESGGAA